MFDWLRLTKVPPLWAIKQIDKQILHVCGKAEMIDKHRTREAKAALSRGEYRGAIRMVDNDLILNAALFRALVPVDEIELSGLHYAQWEGRSYLVSWVPQRNWAYQGKLTVEQVMVNGEPGLSSVEDISSIRHKTIHAEPPLAATDNAVPPLSLSPLDKPEQHFEKQET